MQTRWSNDKRIANALHCNSTTIGFASFAVVSQPQVKYSEWPRNHRNGPTPICQAQFGDSVAIPAQPC